ncbi:adenine deaminase [Clostridium thermosuccinogenes]|uniref:Adenine deaminase n=1 Tax=Clostridium thermosuccinogenes TaxID=84032 RepID=A0A2K2FCF0_9CLOT|nr:adenine deaminase [Pseudoclostridium thermosuccinogenes]AUS98280.1 adenine deaminase [Pseudoclostridium thermosuccinogenes]PNT96458.1 adenine deaminase [Pseudoclostridium thermosuccinogenes]PNT98162.1 adenine deaminase [Pseudoclostridium thermosuccinogenes]
MEKHSLKKRIDTAAGRRPADLVIKNCRIVDVYNSTIIEGKSIAISDGCIVGIGDYQGVHEIDAQGQYAAPGFIDSHIHIESSYVTPEEIGRLLVPHGTTTIIADPHEIVNVCGMEGMNYMLEASKGTKLDIRYMLPSCVPATPFENAGAVIDAAKMKEPLRDSRILGLGEFMNYPGVVEADDEVMNKLLIAINGGKLIDGHSPGLTGKELNAYVACGIHTDHECSTEEEMLDRLSRGLYILLREGSACHNLRTLLKAVTPANSRRCLLCSDDRQPETILKLGHLDNHLRICVEEGISPVTAIQMASLNAAECYGLHDRGAIAPGLRADIVLLDNLKDFNVQRVFIQGEEVAREGKYLPEIRRCDISAVQGSFHVKDFSVEKLRLKLNSRHVNVIDILPGGVVTAKGMAEVALDEKGEFIWQPEQDIVKAAVVERHRGTGNVGLALIRGYGIRSGAVALSIAHDSHNIITVGTKDEDMALAVESLVKQGGGIVLVKNGEIINCMPMVVGGIMSDRSGEWVSEKLSQIHKDAYEQLGISKAVEPIMTLCFMSLPVIPEIKVTDKGLFDVTRQAFIPIEADI